MQKLKFKIIFLATIIFIVGGSLSFAQQPISPVKQTLIRELLEAAGGKKSAVQMVDMMISFQEMQTSKMLPTLVENDNSLTPAQKQELYKSMAETAERVSKQSRDFFTQKLNLGQMIEEVSYPIYDKNFTESELRDLIAFYRTPTGQKTVEIMPKMTMEAMTAFSEKLTPKLEEFMKDAVEAELTKAKQELQKGKSTKVNPN